MIFSQHFSSSEDARPRPRQDSKYLSRFSQMMLSNFTHRSGCLKQFSENFVWLFYSDKARRNYYRCFAATQVHLLCSCNQPFHQLCAKFANLSNLNGGRSIPKITPGCAPSDHCFLISTNVCEITCREAWRPWGVLTLYFSRQAGYLRLVATLPLTIRSWALYPRHHPQCIKCQGPSCYFFIISSPTIRRVSEVC